MSNTNTIKKWILHYESPEQARTVDSFDDIRDWFSKANNITVRVSEFPTDMSSKFGPEFKHCYAIRYVSTRRGQETHHTFFNVGYCTFTDERYSCNPYQDEVSFQYTITYS